MRKWRCDDCKSVCDEPDRTGTFVVCPHCKSQLIFPVGADVKKPKVKKKKRGGQIGMDF